MWTPKINVTNTLCGQSVPHDVLSKLGFAKGKRIISCPKNKIWSTSEVHHRIVAANHAFQVNYTAWCHTVGPVTLMKWDSMQTYVSIKKGKKEMMLKWSWPLTFWPLQLRVWRGMRQFHRLVTSSFFQLYWCNNKSQCMWSWLTHVDFGIERKIFSVLKCDLYPCVLLYAEI